MRTEALGIALMAGLLLVAPSAMADECKVDNDCSSACGYEVCSQGACIPAGTKPAGQDGWCNTSTDCGCFACPPTRGAFCDATTHHCSFTTCTDAPLLSLQALGCPPPDGDESDAGASATVTDAQPPPDVVAACQALHDWEAEGTQGCSVGASSLGSDLPIGVPLLGLLAAARRWRRPLGPTGPTRPSII
jgi:hypothetical protein